MLLIFYNGILSFSEGIDAVFQKRFSWATIKLYYAVYYLIRATLSSKEIAILRCRSMFRLVARVGRNHMVHQIENIIQRMKVQ